jgi:hypothetical protein
MTTVLLVALLLTGTPNQDSVSTTRYEKLESRVNELEKRVSEQETRAESFQSILTGQRWTFGIGVTLITILVTVLFGFIGWGIFEWRAGKIEEGLDGKINGLEDDIESDRDFFEGKIDNIEKRVWRQEVDSRQQKMFQFEGMGMNQPVMKSAAYLIEKISEEEEGLDEFSDILHLAINRINNCLFKENYSIKSQIYDGITDNIDEVISNREDVPEKLLELREMFENRVNKY